MARQFLRTGTITFSGGSSSKTIPFGGPTDLRVRFESESSTQQSLGTANIIISNASKQTAAACQKEFTKVVLSCGYQGGSPGVIFSGSITETQSGEREGWTDPLIRVWASDGDAGYNQGKITKTLAAGSTPKDIVQAGQQALAPFGIQMGRVIGVDLSTPVFPRAYVMSGMVRDVLREVALAKGATWNVNGGQLNMVGKDAAVPGNGVVLTPASGLLYQPIQRTDGIIVRCLINSAITVDSNIVLNQGDIIQDNISNASLNADDANKQQELSGQGVSDGTYRVLRVITKGDSRGNIWEMELTCIGAFTGQLNVTQAGQGLS